jgi:hypothetical protein
MRKESKRTAMALVIILIIAVVSSCEKDSSKTGAYTAAQPPFTSFRDIPGITAEEIAEIEALQKKYKTFNYGMTHTTEAFITEDGKVGGYAALLC